MKTLAQEIEVFLLQRKDWISAEELCLIFHVEPRELRATGETPGLCSDFAISGARGFRHINCATNEEWHAFSERLHSHGLAELRRVNTLRWKREGTPQMFQETAV